MKKLLSIISCAVGIAFAVQAQVTSPTLFGCTNLPSTLASNVLSSTTNIVLIPKNSDLSFQWRFHNSAAQGAASLSGSFTIDGTNYGIAPFTLTANNATTVTLLSTNWQHNTIAGYSGVQVNVMTNTGGGMLTNDGALFNRSVLNTLTY